MGISCYRQSPQASSMERMVHGNNLMVCTLVLQPGIFPGCFDGSFNSLCPAVGKENLAEAGSFEKFLCRFHHGNIVEQIRGMYHLIDLILQGLVVCFVSVAQSKNRDTGAKIQIFFSFQIIETHTFSPVQNYRKTVISVEHCIFGSFHIFLTAHHNTVFHPFSKSRFRYLYL